METVSGIKQAPKMKRINLDIAAPDHVVRGPAVQVQLENAPHLLDPFRILVGAVT